MVPETNLFELLAVELEDALCLQQLNYDNRVLDKHIRAIATIGSYI